MQPRVDYVLARPLRGASFIRYKEQRSSNRNTACGNCYILPDFPAEARDIPPTPITLTAGCLHQAESWE